MTPTFRLHKVLTMKEKEKEKALSEYEEAVRRFEQAAEALYNLLKEKEKCEAERDEQLQTGLSIGAIRHMLQYIGNLQRAIDHYQLIVMQAREQMQRRQQRLTELNIEVKKYEKMRERVQQWIEQREKEAESRFLDELAVQRFARQGEL
ncbi:MULTISPECIES: flagellar export protein FliJ [Geobacillus]|uniref:Flagellar FliJ protein n=2 Tax=Geobacillus thermodenitrificans TaxID=33940 RepID=A4IM98_GEOTN|nr:flagellar export protein FliJ [Geobacillus thermodenitrificans]ABO66452.1 Flagellar protein [Geobacillus thermodenitrificans NG80-2]ARA97163.1 flagellar export protein FliJ [Geobacillus thermodenitrificans]MED3906990.1 flagellar export protein FliJ [Geobacillus thermodenitrificans]PJW21190.1 flagellar export protein FliJ [Geobacillus thermodenitrificans]PTR48690.1 flagellar export protein FliJ [Geobacillus thermodenitrificans]